MNNLPQSLIRLANQLNPEQLDRAKDHMRTISRAVVPIMVYLEINQLHQEGFDLEIALIEESISNPGPWRENVTWSPVLDTWLAKHDAKLLLAPRRTKRVNDAGELIVDQADELSLFPADTPGEQGKPQIPDGIHNEWAYAQGQFDALLAKREVTPLPMANMPTYLACARTERDQKQALGYAYTEQENWQAYKAGQREPYLAEIRADYLSGYLSVWPSEPEGGDTTHE